MIKLVYFTIFFLFVFSCKKKADSTAPENLNSPNYLGTRYALWTNYITSTPGAKDAKDRTALVYRFEEATLLEKVEQDGKKYLKLRTVEGKEGFAEEKIYTEAIYVVTTSGLPAFRKPTLTAGTKGNVDAGSYCIAKEIQGEWANVNCLTAKVSPNYSGYEDWYDVWIQTTDPKIVVDPLLNETAGIYRDSLDLIKKINKGERNEKINKELQEKLTKAYEKNDMLRPVIEKVMETMGYLEHHYDAPISDDQQ